MSRLTLAALFALSTLAHAFNTTFGSNPTSCGDYTVEWTGGQGPFILVLLPRFGAPVSFPIPESSISNGVGKFTAVKLPFKDTQVIVAVMGDQTGFGAGGVSDSMTLGTSTSGTCDTAEGPLDFLFNLDSALTQCQSYRVNGYGDARLPVTVRGVIPGGTPFIVGSSSTAQLDWRANVAAGTGIIFWVVDSQGRNGGASDLKLVGSSNDRSCIDASSPSSTSLARPSATGSPTSSPSATTTGTPEEKTSVAGIAGAVVGGLLGIAIIVTMILFFLKQRKKKWEYGAAGRRSNRLDSDVNLAEEGAPNSDISPYTYGTNQTGRAARQPSPPPQFTQPGEGYEPNPFVLPPQSTQSVDLLEDYSESGRPSRHSTMTGTTNMTSAQRKAAASGTGSGSQRQPRFIMHTDADPEEEEEEVIELPPQYSASRRTVAGGSSSSGIPATLPSGGPPQEKGRPSQYL